MATLLDAAERPRRRLTPKIDFGKASLYLSGLVILLIALAAIFAPLLAPYDPYAQDLLRRTFPPFWMEGTDHAHWLGTDHLGRDYLSRLIYGARISLTIGFVTALVSGFIGTALGVTAGYFGGRVDAAISFVITARLAIPVILVALAVVAMVGSSFEIVIAVLGLLLWDRYALVMRAATQQLRGRDFVLAAQIQGASHWQIVRHEILPNIVPPLLVVMTVEIAQAIMLEAALSFLGLGVPAPLPSWGLMLQEGKANVLFDPWLITIPGAALFTLALVDKGYP
ncbi:ABC transporter permease [uncultured Bosea sp.]|uniref:ABC transporter permease n=1 Tax=uncultured Bosea sp. TaxID=211457 RepID=UPI0025D5FDFF|nr:ABC transporter permease [uncultured Bosea sp.]